MTGVAWPTVSVIMPTHNRADLIGDGLRSVLAQTFSDFEVVVVDNGSTDGTDRVIVALGDPRIRYFWQPDSGLPANSRNVAIRMARGRYIAFLDSDDLWLPGKLALQVWYMEAHPTVGLTCTNALDFDSNGNRGRMNKISLAGRRTARSLLRGNFVATLTVMVRRRCLDAVGLFNEDPALRGVEDLELWLRVAARFPLAYLPPVTARYRLHDTSLSGSDKGAHMERTVEMLEGLLPSLPISSQEAATALGSYYRRLARERAMAGDMAGATAAIWAAWRAAPGLKNGILICADHVAGEFLGRWLLPWARNWKHTIDKIVWLAGQRGQE